jgi:hypothetical protein
VSADGDDTVIGLPRGSHAARLGGRPVPVSRDMASHPSAHAAPPEPRQESDRRAASDADDEEDDYDAETDDYRAFGRADNKAQPSLVIILKDGSEYAFNYADLASASPDGSMC